MTAMPLPGVGCGPTWGTPAENILQGALLDRGWTITSVNPADRLSAHGSRCASGANVRFGGMDIEALRRFGPNNMKGLPPDRFDIYAAFDAKGHQRQWEKWADFGIPVSSVNGALAFANWRHCHTLFALVPYNAPGIWVASLQHVLGQPQDRFGSYVVSALDCPTLDEWTQDYYPYEGGRLGSHRPPPSGGTVIQLPRAA